MKRIKLVYVISTVDFSYGIKWLAHHMPKEKFEVTFIFMYHKVPVLHQYFLSQNINSIWLPYTNKYNLLQTISKLFWLFRKIKPDIVHPHLFEASLAGLIAAKLAGVPVLLYTRHHASIHHDNFPNAVKYDRFLNRISQKVIAISENVKSILVNLEKIEPEKVIIVHHGFDFSEIQIYDDEINSLKIKYNLSNHFPVVGIISRFTHFKGIQYIIPAFKELLKTQPDAVLVLANAIGDYKTTIYQLLEDLPVESYRLIEFEQNVFALYRCFDVFVHTPINETVEAFGQIYVEAMALNVPVVCTLSGIAYEFIVDKKNAIVVPFCNSESVVLGIKQILKDPVLKSSIISQAHKDVMQLFDIKQMIDRLEAIYKQLLSAKNK